MGLVNSGGDIGISLGEYINSELRLRFHKEHLLSYHQYILKRWYNICDLVLSRTGRSCFAE